MPVTHTVWLGILVGSLCTWARKASRDVDEYMHKKLLNYLSPAGDSVGRTEGVRETVHVQGPIDDLQVTVAICKVCKTTAVFLFGFVFSSC